MKALPAILASLSLSGYASAAFESWTNKEGKSVELDLMKVTQADGQPQGEFKLRDGRTAILKASDLSEADAKRLAAWKPAAADTAATAAPAPAAEVASAFDKVLDGNLVSLSGKRLAAKKDFVKPTKYYLFYYTASWCGPCHKFTPSLVEFYNKNKPGNNEFELVLITSDSSDDAMESYAGEFKMPWPQLKLSRTEKFKKEFKYPGGGIPNLVLTDTEGKLIKGSYEGQTYVGPTVVMNHLGTLLKK
ncbi:redoxin family protein [Luteolibacter yonseiensis]|uniref:Redoxin family protein n=1 Tax=Luteolibacter yonseiensis TaxID=1144680 RepID=A0A934R802_9BACT|nr:thioredoxin-like domain-containing protein [Luteolibacter yonseiensis]MBK1816910.1 redoxin family protein [Luteolibacter yonseiensis]